jgi:hypothetical protein
MLMTSMVPSRSALFESMQDLRTPPRARSSGASLIVFSSEWYAGQRENDAARLAREEEVWLCNIVNHLL